MPLYSATRPLPVNMKRRRRFNPSRLADLEVWLKADAGVIEEAVTSSFVSEVVLTDSGASTSDGTYERSTGGTTQFDGPNGNYIYWDGGAWIVYDNDVDSETYINYEADLDAGSWEENNSSGAPSAVNTVANVTSQRITAWQDQSGNNRNFTKSIPNSGWPTLSNGIPLFTASSTYNDLNASILALPSASLNLTTPYTLIAVVRAGANNSCIFSKSNNDSKRRKYQISVNGGSIYSLESKNSGDTSIEYNTGTGNNVSIKRLIVSQYSSNTSGVLRYNGNQVAAASNDVGIDQTNTASIFIGASPFSQGIGYNAEGSTEMYVYEIIFYSRAIIATEIDQVEAYLNAKYQVW